VAVEEGSVLGEDQPGAVPSGVNSTVVSDMVTTFSPAERVEV
jgi:hypothetical protein